MLAGVLTQDRDLYWGGKLRDTSYAIRRAAWCEVARGPAQRGRQIKPAVAACRPGAMAAVMGVVPGYRAPTRGDGCR
jgi:hypothetical protein